MLRVLNGRSRADISNKVKKISVLHSLYSLFHPVGFLRRVYSVNNTYTVKYRMDGIKDAIVIYKNGPYINKICTLTEYWG